MIIVSQDKEGIINLDNIAQIFLSYCDEDKEGYFIRFETINELYDDLGEYKTKERAKEVLQDIAQSYVNECKRYIMPKE